MLVALLTGLLAGCIVIPLPAAEVKVGQSRDVQAPSGGVALSVLFARDFSPEASRSLGEEMVECITRDLAKAAPEVRLVPEEEFYRAVFGVKPGEVMLRADMIGPLLARPDIRQRVGESGLTHLILVSGATSHHNGDGFIGFIGGYGGGIVVAHRGATRSTQLTASIFELAGGRVGVVEASAEGRQGIFAIIPLAVVWLRATESASCHALGAEVAQAISGRPHDESR